LFLSHYGAGTILTPICALGTMSAAATRGYGTKKKSDECSQGKDRKGFGCFVGSLPGFVFRLILCRSKIGL
jgi:hypothetical protein